MRRNGLLRSLFRYAVDGILSFSSAPVTMAGTAGALLILAAVVTGIWALLTGNGLAGIPLLICLILLLNGRADVLHLHSGSSMCRKIIWKARNGRSISSKRKWDLQVLNFRIYRTGS